jgi:Uma2 family endonuclease
MAQVHLATLLNDHAKPHGLGNASVEVDFILARNPDTVRKPDVVFVRADHMPPEGPPAGKFWEFVPDFVIEVRSLSERPGRIADKVRDFQDAGIPLVWVVAPHFNTVTVHELGKEPRVFAPPAEITAAPVLPDFKCAVAVLLPPYL